MSDKHTAEPWNLGELENCLGYDCMTHGIRCGPALLDGADYGQEPCANLPPNIAERMVADARLIAASPKLLAALRLVAGLPGFEPGEPYADTVLSAIAEALDGPRP